MHTWLLVDYQNLTRADTSLRSAVWLLIYWTKCHASEFVIVLTIHSNYVLEYTLDRVLQVSDSRLTICLQEPVCVFASTLRTASHSFVDGNESSWKSLKYMYCTTTTTTTTIITTSPQSNLRRAHHKGSIDSDDSQVTQVQGRPSTGKPSLRYSPSTRITNYSASTALVCWRYCALRSRSS